MNVSSDFLISIKQITLAHELNAEKRILSDYRAGRKVFGMSYAISGKAEYRLHTGKKITVSQGDVLFFDKDSSYLAVTLDKYRHFTVNFELCEPLPKSFTEDGGVSVIHSGTGAVYKGLFLNLTQIWREKRFGFRLKAQAVLYELFAQFFSDISLLGENDYLKRRLLPVKEVIDARYKDALTVGELAAIAGMSATHFRREFERAFGTSVIRYRDEVRLMHAKDALSSGEYTISEAGRRCGFDDPSYFARFFKKHMGICAQEYKKLYR